MPPIFAKQPLLKKIISANTKIRRGGQLSIAGRKINSSMKSAIITKGSKINSFILQETSFLSNLLNHFQTIVTLYLSCHGFGKCR